MTESDRMESLAFTDAVRDLGCIAREHDWKMPGYRAVLGGPFEIIKHKSGASTVQVDRGQPDHRVVLDMVRGLLAVNHIGGDGSA